MRITNWIAPAGCLLAITAVAWAQDRKPGLWEMTTTQSWQQSPMPPGAPSIPNSPFAGGKTVTQVCVTQQMLDKYGGIVPTSHGCDITNIVRKGNTMTADMVCNGAMSGKGTLESTALDAEHAKGKSHFVGSIKMSNASLPVEWTTETTSVFKSADCGSVKPAAMPGK